MTALPKLHKLLFELGDQLESEEDVEEYLESATGFVCPYCGREHLRVWERLNGRCEHCRHRWLQRAAEGRKR